MEGFDEDSRPKRKPEASLGDLDMHLAGFCPGCGAPQFRNASELTVAWDAGNRDFIVSSTTDCGACEESGVLELSRIPGVISEARRCPRDGPLRLKKHSIGWTDPVILSTGVCSSCKTNSVPAFHTISRTFLAVWHHGRRIHIGLDRVTYEKDGEVVEPLDAEPVRKGQPDRGLRAPLTN